MHCTSFENRKKEYTQNKYNSLTRLMSYNSSFNEL